MESEEKIKQRGRKALEHIDKRGLILAPDAGLDSCQKNFVLKN